MGGNDNERAIYACSLIRTSLYGHQKIALSITTKLPETALLMEQGTGKTLVAIATMGFRYLEGEIDRALIVAPLSVIPGWKKELKAYADFEHTIYDLSQEDTETRDAMLKVKGVGLEIALINYESTWRYYLQLAKWNPEMIICDESQKIKRHKAKQSKAMHMLGDNADFKMILTGTPVTQSPLDLWSQYRFLRPPVFGDNFFRFRGKYAVMGGWMDKQVVGYKDLEDLATRAHRIAYRVTKAEALDLPPIVDQERYIELKGDSAWLYHKIETEFGAMLQSGETVTIPIVLTQLLRLQQITGGFVKNDAGEIEQVGNEKLTELMELLDDLPSHKKVVVFCRFIPEVEAIAKSSTRRHLLLTGATKDRGEVIRQFQEDPNITLLIAQIQTGGLGITLTAADTMVFYSTTFGYADYEQARARVHRIGQKSTSVTYIHLLAKNSVDEDILAALRGKRDIAEYVVDKLKKPRQVSE